MLLLLFAPHTFCQIFLEDMRKCPVLSVATAKAMLVVQRLLHYDCPTLFLLSTIAPRCKSRRETWREPHVLAMFRGVSEY